MQKQKKVILLIIALVLVAGLAYGISRFMNQTSVVDEQVFCTQDAMECPDGSYVGRTGPKCEFAACPMKSDPTLDKVGVGQNVFINGVKITLNKIVQDNRCPVDVQCIQVGQVTANVTLQSIKDKKTLDINSSGAPVPFGTYKISIEDIRPVRKVNSPIDPDSYVLTFRVKSN